MARPSHFHAAILLGAALLVGWMSLTGFVWTDYENEAEKPLAALVGGDIGAFLAGAPGYGGSLILRAPFAFLPSVWGGGDLAVYRSMAAPCLLAGVVLGLVLIAHRRRAFPEVGWPILFGLLAVASPLTLLALDVGHPEELLGATLCAGAVLAAIWDRPLLAAVLLGAALGNKAWAVLAVGPVLVTLSRDRIKVLVIAGVVAAALTVPFLAAAGSGHVGNITAHTSTIFQPQQIWWFLGDTGNEVIGGNGLPKVDYRTPPAWLPPLSHPLIAALGLPLTLLWWWRRRGTAHAREDALLLLALLFMLRCLLDTWNFSYYHIPLAISLLCWEALRHARPPVMTLTVVTCIWLMWQKLPGVLSPDMQSVAYVLPALALTAWLIRGVYFPGSHLAVQHEREADRVATARGQDARTGGLRPSADVA